MPELSNPVLVNVNDKDKKVIAVIEHDPDLTDLRFNAYKITSYNDEGKPNGRLLVIHGMIKRIGEAHLNFGDYDNKGYIHCDSPDDILFMSNLLQTINHLAKTKIKDFIE